MRIERGPAIALAVALPGMLAFLQAAATPETARSGFDWGVVQTMSAYDQAIPFMAIGAAFPPSATPRRVSRDALALVAAIVLGLFLVFPRIEILGTVSFALAGLLLVAGACGPRWTGSILVVLLGMSLGMTVHYDSTPAGWPYVAGAALGALCLIVLGAMGALLLTPSPRRIAAAILGSWLLAVALLLAGLQSAFG